MWIVAADSVDLNAVLIPAVLTFLGVVVTQTVLLIAPIVKSRFERATSSPPTAPSDGSVLLQFAKDLGQLDQRANDNDERDDVQDHRHERTEDRLEALERYNDHRDPDWRRR